MDLQIEADGKNLRQIRNDLSFRETNRKKRMLGSSSQSAGSTGKE